MWPSLYCLLQLIARKHRLTRTQGCVVCSFHHSSQHSLVWTLANWHWILANPPPGNELRMMTTIVGFTCYAHLVNGFFFFFFFFFFFEDAIFITSDILKWRVKNEQ